MNRKTVNNIAGMYDMEDTIGSGHFAVVKVARHVFTGLRVAVKVIDKLKLDEMSRAHLFQEVKCMKLVFHPNIIRLYEVIDTQTKLYLILELGEGGDLYDFISKHEKGVEEGLARSIFRDIVSAISYCHKLHIVHRDLKPENLVFCNVKSTPVVKLTDFGLSRSFMPGEMLDTACGSLEYSAPEILLGESYKAPTVDVWSLGVILYMLIVGRSPFAYGSPNETLTHIMDGKYSIPSTVSAQCKHLIVSMLQVDVSARASMDQIYHHPWLAQNQSVTVAMPLLSTLSEITLEDKDFVLHRMEQGNFGSRDSIVKAITESPYSSTAATFYLLAEAELHRRLHKEYSIDSPLKRKFSVPAKFQRIGLSPRSYDVPDGDKQLTGRHGIGSAEQGVLRPRKTICTPPTAPTTGLIGTPLSAQYRRVTTHYDSPLDQMQQTTPMGGAVKWVGPPSSFPLTTLDSQEEEQTNTTTNTATANATTTTVTTKTATVSNDDSNTPISNYLHGKGLRPRLSTFEEESESETSVHTGGGSSRASPVPSFYRPSAILNNSPTMKERSGSLDRVRSITRLSPSMKKQNSFSRSDGSDDAESEEDDEIVELLTASGNYSNTLSMLRKRLERGTSSHSPHLSRKSPTHCWTGSSDEEATNMLDDKHKQRTKHRVLRERSKSRKNRIRRVDSASSDDGTMESNRKTLPLLKCSSNKYPNINVPAINVENCKRNSIDDADCTADVLRELMDLKSIAKKIELSDDEFDADNYSISETDSKTDLSKTDLLAGLDSVTPMQAIQELPSPSLPNDDIIPLTDFKEFNGRVATPSAVSLHVADSSSQLATPAVAQISNKPNVVRTSICDVL